MAIQDSFNLSRATSSQSYAFKCWYNYNYGGNTMKISSKDMGEITQTWNGELKNWRANAENDDNKYEIDDDDYTTAKLNGKESAKDKTGYDGGKGGMIANTVFDGLAAGAGAVTGKWVGRGLGNVLDKKGVCVLYDSNKNPAIKSGDDNVKLSDVATVIMASAVAAKYVIAKPNKEQKKACDELQNTMTDSQNALTTAQEDMAVASDEITDLSDQAIAYNEDAKEEIEDKKTEYDMYKTSYDALMVKVNNGETLSEDEKTLLKELVPLMQEMGIGINETSEEATNIVSEIHDEMGTYQDTYDNVAETIGEVEGVTDYAENFDSATRTMCYVEAGAQTINAASATKAAAKLMGKGPWGWGFAALGAAAAAGSGVAAYQQYNWAGEVGNEIHMRRDTQEINATAMDIFEENTDIYSGQIEGVEELEHEIPDDMEDSNALVEQLTEESSVVLAQTTQNNEINTEPDNNKEKKI